MRAGDGSAAASVPGWREAAALNCKIDLLTGRCERRQMESSAAGAHLRGAAASILTPLQNPLVLVFSRRLAPICRAKVHGTAAPKWRG